MQCYPLKMTPLFKERIWGGRRLATRLGKPLPPHTPVGESWELSDLPEDRSVVANGPWQGRTLREVLDAHGTDFGFTAEQAAAPFGLLIKLLDAEQVLSVQVHPDTEAAGRFPGARLKTECWYVMEAEPDARIYHGLRDGVGPDNLRAALAQGTVDQLLREHRVGAGDFFFVPAGTVHALGAGVLVAEIQTPSDTTYRLFDWNRVDAAGNSRELHVEQALASIHYQAPPAAGEGGCAAIALLEMAAAWGDARELVRCPYFSVARVTVEPGSVGFTSAQPAAVLALEGTGRIGPVGAGTEFSCDYAGGDTFLLPVLNEGTLEVGAASTFLLACLGPVKAP